MRVTNQITFTAKDDAEALRLASERLGRDAVILSSQMVKEGGVLGLFQHSVLRVTAGILEDDNPKPQPPKRQQNLSSANSISNMDDDTRRENLIAFQRLLDFKERGPAASQMNNAPIPPMDLGDEGYLTDNVKISPEGLKNAYGLTTKPASITPPPSLNPVTPVQPQQPAQSSLSNDDAKVLKEQVGALADRIDFLLQRLTAVENMSMNNINNMSVQDEKIEKKAVRNFQPAVIQSSEDSGIEDILRASEVDEKYIRKLTADYSIAQSKAGNKKIPFTKWLASRIECAADEGNDPIGGRRVMLIGPTGVGKTTTIAKLAAIKALWEHKRVLLLTSDTFRIAAVEQLKTYAKILGVPIEIVFDVDTIPGIVEEHDNADIILMDTAGHSQRDKKRINMYVNLYNSFNPDAVHLVLAANMKYRDMLDVVEHIPDVPVSHLLFTKLDETVSYGSIFNIQQVMGCPVSFLTIGQKVPKDIETAEGIRIAKFLMNPEEERNKNETIRK